MTGQADVLNRPEMLLNTKDGFFFGQLSPLDPVIPLPLKVLVVAVTLLPLALILLGVDLGTEPHRIPLADLVSLPGPDLDNNLQLSMVGPQIHTLLEWSAIVVAVLAALLAFSHFWITGNVTAPVLGVSLLSAGLMDAFHSLAAARVLDTVADSRQLIPFSWAVARTFNALVLALGAGALLLAFQPRRHSNPLSFVTLVAAIAVVLGYLIIQWCINAEHLPVSIFENDTVKRPYDVVALVIYIFAGAFIFPKFKERFPSLFADALVLSIFPAIAVEMHMVFGSSELYDSHYNAAHFLKVLSYLVPFLGLLLDYYLIYQKDQLKTEQLHQTYRELEARTLQLTRSNRNLEKSNQFKSEFLASMSHELRTPLNSVIGFSRILLNDFTEGRNPRGHRAVEAIYRNSTHLLGLINDILDLSKIDAGRMSVVKTEFLVNDLINEVAPQLRAQAEAKGLEFNVVNYARNISLITDRTKLKQILHNLGSNAVKYTERGSITLSVEWQKNGRLGRAVKIAFKDTGIGIAEVDKPKLFTEFGRAEDVEERDIEGTGLGLLITGKLTEILGGYIEFDSEYGVGSEFRVFFPAVMENGSHGQAHEQGQWDRKGLAVVCVDRDVDMLAFMEMAFADSPVSVFTAAHVEQAISRCEDILPDVVCFDPELESAARIRLLRTLYEHGVLRDVVKVAISSDAEMEKQLLADGADGFLRKPFTQTELLRLVKKLAYRKLGTALLVGVSSAHGETLEAQFGQLKIQLFHAADSDAAIEKLSQFLPDFIVINLGSPLVDTNRLIMMLGNDEHFRKLPQVLFNGIDHQRKLAFVNEIQEELRESNPSAQELIGGVLTIIRRANTSLMRIETLNRSLKSASTPAEQAVDSEAPVDTGEKRVLVVDDSKDNLELMDWILDDTGIDHDCVRSGREALKAVMQTNYSLLLLDIGLPDLRGDEVTRRLRATRSYGKVPIVAVTVHSSKTEIEQLLAAGVNEVLAKPVDQEKLLKTVRGYLAGQTS